MTIQQGYAYHIKDSFFSLVNDSKLMSNKEDGNYRPHYYAIEDQKNKGIFWMIPISSKVKKYKKIVNDKIRKWGKCNTIKIGLFAGDERAYLLQNAFPIYADFFDHIHTVGGTPITIHNKLDRKLKSDLKELLALHKQKKYNFYSDVDSIMNVMVEYKEKKKDLY